MSLDSAFEIFGIPGIVLFGVGSLAYYFHQKYSIELASYDFLNKNVATKTLNNIWEEGNNIGEDHYNSYNYGKSKKINNQSVWNINIPQNENGSLYIYRNFTELPSDLDNGKYFFRISVKNLSDDTIIKFQKKRYYGKLDEWNCTKYKFIYEEEICKNGVHYFEPNTSINEIEGDGDDKQTITKEQLGIFIKPGTDSNIDNLIIEEAYIGEKCWKINLLPYLSNKYYLLIKPKAE